MIYDLASEQWKNTKAGVVPTNLLTKTAAYTAVAGDWILANAASGAFTITLPSNPAVGAMVNIQKIDSSINVVTVNPTGSGTIHGDIAGSTTLESRWTGITVQHQGSDVWSVVATNTPGGPISTYSMAPQTYCTYSSTIPNFWEVAYTGTWTTYTGTSAETLVYNSSNASGDAATFKFNIPVGSYEIHMWGGPDQTRGIVTYEVEDAPSAGTYTTLGTIDWYQSGTGVFNVKKSLTGLTISGTGGIRRIRLKCVSKNGSSSSYGIPLQILQLVKTA
jgi:hypothetical protein